MRIVYIRIRAQKKTRTGVFRSGLFLKVFLQSLPGLCLFFL